MDDLEAKLALATDHRQRDLLGALGLVVNSKGTIISISLRDTWFI